MFDRSPPTLEKGPISSTPSLDTILEFLSWMEKSRFDSREKNCSIEEKIKESLEQKEILEANTKIDLTIWKAVQKQADSECSGENTPSFHLINASRLSKDRKAIKYKWVLRVKTHPDGSLDKYKARLVAKGFSQISGIDYIFTHALVLWLKSLRC